MGLNRATAELLAQRPVCNLAPKVTQAMATDTGLSPGDWVAEDTILDSANDALPQEVWQILRVEDEVAYLTPFKVKQDGSLQESEARVAALPRACSSLTPITVIQYAGKCQWRAVWEVTSSQPAQQQQQEQERERAQMQRLVWFGKKTTSPLVGPGGMEVEHG